MRRKKKYPLLDPAPTKDVTLLLLLPLLTPLPPFQEDWLLQSEAAPIFFIYAITNADRLEKQPWKKNGPRGSTTWISRS
jgi:hypothetical protein